jgi:hypothetical protein
MTKDLANANSNPLKSKGNLTDRQKRLGEALRENLRKRKSQTNERNKQDESEKNQILSTSKD